jgi:putative ABC transport system permease protein
MIWRRKRMLEKLDLDSEDHIRREMEDNIDRGMKPEEARYAALRKFGNVTRVREDTREIWSFTWLEQLLQDFRYTFRTLLRNPGFAAAAILSFGLGIGVNTAVFSVINTVLLQRLPYPDPDRIVAFSNKVTAVQPQPFKEGLAGADLAEWLAHAKSFDRMAGYWYRDSTLASANAANRIGVAPVAGDFWAITGARATIGRLFDPNRPAHSIVLSYQLFEHQFRGDARIIGKTVLLDGAPVTVVGILPANFRFLFHYFGGASTSGIGAFVPAPPLVRTEWSHWFVVGHLKRGASIESALAELQGIEANVLKAYPDRWFPGIAWMRLQPLQAELTANSRQALLILQLAGFFVLMIACANIANLLLARGAARSREIAIRAAVGAGTARVLRQFLAEGLVLALTGGMIGVFIAWSAIAMMKQFGLGAVPRLAETAIDGNVLAFTLSLCLISGILFGFAPAVTLWRADLQVRNASVGGGLRLRRVLVASELALAIVLLTGAGLMVKSFWKMYTNPPGFSPENTLLMKVSLSGPQYADVAKQTAYLNELLRKIEALPGVQASGIASTDMLLLQSNSAAPPIVDRFQNSLVSPGYFKAIGMQLLKGRWITDTDPPDVIVINETMARRAFGDRDPIGHRIDGLAHPLVVGVAANLKYSKRDAEPGPEMFHAYSKSLGKNTSVTVAVRMPGDPLGISSAARNLITGIDPTQPVYDIETLEQALTKSIAARRFNLFLLGVFALSALLMALIGIYGVMAYAVTQRTREIGIRMALGAQRGSVVRMVIAQGMRITVWGVVVGLCAALAFTRVMASLLYDVTPNDPATFAVIVSILVACVLLACWGPAFRASLVDPQVALRHE